MNYQHLTSFATKRAQEELAISAPLWDAFTLRQTLPGTPHVDTKCIPLRGAFPFAASYTVDVARARTDLAAMLPECMALANRLIAGLAVAEVGNVILATLKPGGWIRPHPDEGPYARHFDRYHIVINSEPGNWFNVNGELYHPCTGDVFTFNHQVTHSVGNDSTKERVHLIVDIKLKD
jgi:Aspartyl/Asparaginyl beta-hydroxylase